MSPPVGKKQGENGGTRNEKKKKKNDSSSGSSNNKKFVHKRKKRAESCPPQRKRASNPSLGGPPSSKKRKRNHQTTSQKEGQQDPFPHALRCGALAAGTQPRCFFWDSDPYISTETERQLLSHLIVHKKERGMLREYGTERVQKLRSVTRSHGVPLDTALSLRRLTVQRRNMFMTSEDLRLGSERNIREAADLFEKAVGAWLEKYKIDFWSEIEQRQAVPEGNKSPPTPDFVLKEPLLMRRGKRTMDKSTGKEEADVWNERLIHWIEVKMFYGASTIDANDCKGAVGRILQTCRKYVKHGGSGAIVFLYGCGEDLAAAIEEAGVLALDCMKNNIGLDLEALETQLRTWCANSNGEILM